MLMWRRSRSASSARAVARARLGLLDDEPVVGTVGNFTAKKDQACLLRRHGDPRRAGPSRARRPVGTGPLEQELRSLADLAGLEARIIFAGMRDDVFELLSAFDVFVLSSRFEGLPIAMLEAMAAHVPPVATRVGWHPRGHHRRARRAARGARRSRIAGTRDRASCSTTLGLRAKLGDAARRALGGVRSRGSGGSDAVALRRSARTVMRAALWRLVPPPGPSALSVGLVGLGVGVSRVLAWSMSHTSFDVWGGILVAPILIALTVPLALSARARPTATRRPPVWSWPRSS